VLRPHSLPHIGAMGQTYSGGGYFGDVSVKDNFRCIQTLWSEEDLEAHIQRLKDTTLNFSLDKAKFVRLLQMSTEYEASVATWFHEFTQDRVSQVVDGLEFLSACIMVSAKVQLYSKICLLYSLFDLDKTGYIRKDEFTIFLKSAMAGLHRMHSGLPPPASVQELSNISAQFFGTLPDGQALSMKDFFMWMTEAHPSLHYLSVLSRLGRAIFVMGTNQRYQLGLHLEPPVQRVPAPILNMEGIRISSIATGESHSLFLTQEGRIWSCGVGFCGILGHGNISDCLQPRLIESLEGARIVDVAVGVRHSAAVSEKGQVFTWGAADVGQLGHGSADDLEMHERVSDPRTGGFFSYASKPTVVMGLFGKKITVSKVSCCNFTTVALTDQGRIYSWGNNTDGQCGLGQKCPHQKLTYLDPHMHRTAMQVVSEPGQVQTGDLKFRSISSGGYHVLAVDMHNRLWTWGQGLWGKLGHGNQQSVYEPKLVDALKHHICQATAAGESHSVCLCAMFRLTVTGSPASVPFSPVSYLGMPTGRVDRHWVQQQPVTPLHSDVELQAFSSAKLVEVGLPFNYIPNHALFESKEAVQNSIVLVARSLSEGEWLKLSSCEFDFNVKISSGATPLTPHGKIQGPIMLMAEQWDVEDCAGKICIFQLSHTGYQVTSQTPRGELQAAILGVAAECRKGAGLACICILPKQVSEFDVSVPQHLYSGFPIGVMGYEHGLELANHLERLKNIRIAAVPDGLPEEVRGWEERREDSTGNVYYENAAAGRRRSAPPQVLSGSQAALVTMQEDSFLFWLKDILAYRPRGIIVSQTSWRPDVELLELPENLFDQEQLETPIVLVSYEVGDELRGAAALGHELTVSMEFQQTGAIFAWGNGSDGQLGLAGLEHRTLLQSSRNALTGEEHAFSDRPAYVAHLHEHQVAEIACGAAHTVAVTAHGEVFSWGAADSLGVTVSDPFSGVPVLVEQLDVVKAVKACAGHHHTFVIADMPHKSVV